MFIKKIILAVAAAISLYSAETNAASISANKCTLGLLPFGTTMYEESKKQEIIKAYESKGFYVSVLNSEAEIADVEYISDASVECLSTYFGIFAKTTVRLVQTSNNKIVAKTVSPGIMDLWSCKIDLFSAIQALPSCQLK